MTTTNIARRTPLYELHKEAGGKLVDFHGWELPVQYSSIVKEHQAVRTACGIFDVSHMGQVTVEGPQALEFVQKINSNDAERLRPGDAMYSHMPNERGGIVDDIIVSRLAADRFFIVVNAATREKDFAWMTLQAEGLDVRLADRSDDYGMVALQGPRAAELMGLLAPKAPALKRFGALELEFFGKPSLITRTGYTGEDGCEFIVPAEVTPQVWQALMEKGRPFGLLPCGLGCRDTLRLEAGYLLYGADIDDEHSPFEAGYGWVVKLTKEDFIGKKWLAAQKESGLRRRLTGIRMLEGGVPRAGMAVTLDGERLGTLTSATFSPTLRIGIGMGYFDRTDLAAGTRVALDLHGRTVAAEVAALPFYRLPKER